MLTANESGSKRLSLSPVKNFVNTIFVPVCVFVISLGSFSEAFILVEDLYVSLKTKFSNQYEYDTLSKIHVGNTQAYVEELLGAPAAIKNIDEGLDVNYFINEKYLVNGYFTNGRMVAFTVVAIADGFSPALSWYNGKALGEGSLQSFNEQAQAFTFDNAKTNRFFIELIPNELSGFFQNSYLGAVQYGQGSVNQELLAKVYDSEVYGSDEETIVHIATYRAQANPNFYGQGELDINAIQKGMLSNGEFLNYFSNL
ncbi:hypothetical protein SAMN02745866_02261 [Alteromonadaceae bacterium Bs31]|nr:hypothetical protein SAMN02745866_02261 [Alteromonadaceae bacterium Bs31]